MWNYRINPAHKDLKKRDDAKTCVTVIKAAYDAYDRKNYPVCKDYLANAMRFSESSIALLLLKSWVNYFMGEYYECIADSGKLLKLEAENLEALELRGRSYYLLGELETAMNHYRQGLKLDPEHQTIKTVYRLGKKIQDNNKKAAKALEKGDFSKAAEHLQKVIDSDPQHPHFSLNANVDIADTYRKMKKIAEARVSANRLTCSVLT